MNNGLLPGGTPQKWTSAELALPANSSQVLKVAHPLRQVPRTVAVSWVCKVAEQGYQPGWEVKGVYNTNYTIAATADQVLYVQSGQPSFLQYSSPGSAFNPTVAKWTIKFHLEL